MYKGDALPVWYYALRPAAEPTILYVCSMPFGISYQVFVSYWACCMAGSEGIHI